MKAQFKQSAIKSDSIIKGIIDDLNRQIDIEKIGTYRDNDVLIVGYEIPNLPEKALSAEDLGYILQSPDATFEDAKLWIEIDKSILDNEYTTIAIEDEEDVITETSISYRDYFQIMEGQTKAILRLSDAPKNANGGISCYCSESTLLDVMGKTGSQVILIEAEVNDLKITSEYGI